MFSLQTSVEKMGSNFLVAGLIPSLGFVMSVVFAFEPILPPKVASRLGFSTDPISQFALLIISATLILGFTLTSLNTFFLKVFEGYILVQRVPLIRNFQLKRYRAQKAQLQLLKKKIARYEKRKGKAAQKILSRLYEDEIGLITRHQYEFPLRENELLPTRFGNILKAAEAYPMERYRIDAVPMWPRIVHVIPQDYDNRIEHTNNELTFLINCAILSAVFAIIAMSAAGYQFFIHILAEGGKQSPLYLVKINLPANIYYQRSLIYVVISVVSGIAAIIFNRASLLTVDDFGHLIRGVYDLFRFDLLKKLHLELPADAAEDMDIWTRVSFTFNVGHQLEDRKSLKDFIFTHPQQTPRKKDE